MYKLDLKKLFNVAFISKEMGNEKKFKRFKGQKEKEYFIVILMRVNEGRVIILRVN